MAARSHVRVISLLVSLSLVIGAWLAFEYADPSLRASAINLPNRMSGGDGEQVRALAAGQDRDSLPLALSQILPKKLAVTFKCEKNGHVQYGDKPCGKDERTLKVTAAEYPQPEMHDRLERMRVGLLPQDSASSNARDGGDDLLSPARSVGFAPR